MTSQSNAVLAHITAAGYTEDRARAGLAYAEAQGAAGEDEILSLAMSRILYGDADLEDGSRYDVEAGSVDWSAYAAA